MSYLIATSAARSLLDVLERHQGREVKLMPIGSEVPYEGTVLSVVGDLVELNSRVDLDTDERAAVHVRIDRIEAVVLLAHADDEVTS